MKFLVRRRLLAEHLEIVIYGPANQNPKFTRFPGPRKSKQGCSKRYGPDLERTEGKLIEDVKPSNGRCVSETGDELSWVKWWMSLFSRGLFHLRPMARLCCETGTDSPSHDNTCRLAASAFYLSLKGSRGDIDISSLNCIRIPSFRDLLQKLLEAAAAFPLILRRPNPLPFHPTLT